MLLYPVDKKEKSIVLPKYGKSIDKDFDSFIQFCSHFAETPDISLLKRAYDFNVRANHNLLRKSGDPYYIHPLEVATIVVKNIGYDNIMVASALLHDVLGKNNLFSIEDIRSEFGDTIAEIVQNIDRITYFENNEIGEIEYYRRLLLSLFTDVRIIFIKISDRLYEMRNIFYEMPETQSKLAEDTLQIYAPLADRFGLAPIKSELEDISFRVLDRKNYEYVVKELKMSKGLRENYLKEISNSIVDVLKRMQVLNDNNISFEVHGRVKHIYSIYHKSLLRQKPISELYDLFGLRIIIDTDNPMICYEVMNSISYLFPRIEGTYKDYIKNPKPNGYQSLHCAFLWENKQKFEVQIRTRDMHILSEKGLTAHYKYKSGFVPADSVLESAEIENWMNEVRKILEQANEVPTEKLFESFKYGVFTEEIYVVTPRNEVKILPKGSSLLDFAYLIHTDLGLHCLAGKVNGRIKPLSYQLQNGDVVEIITSENTEPDYSHLNIVQTSKARNAIEKYLKLKEKKLVLSGKDIVNSLIRSSNLHFSKDKLIELTSSFLGFANLKDFYIALTRDKDWQEILTRLFSRLKKVSELPKKKDLIKELGLEKELLLKNKTVDKILQLYKDNLVMANCCLPVPGDEAIFYIHNNTGIVHRKNCPVFLDKFLKEDIVYFNFKWELIETGRFETRIIVSANDRAKLYEAFEKYFNKISSSKIYFVGIRNQTSSNEDFSVFVTVSVRHKEEVDELLNFLIAELGLNAKRYEAYSSRV
ncbi:MAG: RelA/SpoT family protein [Ignavibacteria bacterium]|nr:RelA/SpoT family protein [Ignavibacteria bacterium]